MIDGTAAVPCKSNCAQGSMCSSARTVAASTCSLPQTGLSCGPSQRVGTSRPQRWSIPTVASALWGAMMATCTGTAPPPHPLPHSPPAAPPASWAALVSARNGPPPPEERRRAAHAATFPMHSGAHFLGAGGRFMLSELGFRGFGRVQGSGHHRYVLDASARVCAGRIELGRPIYSTAALVCGEAGFTLYVGCHDGHLWCLSCSVGAAADRRLATLHKLWSVEAASPIFASPSLAWCAPISLCTRLVVPLWAPVGSLYRALRFLGPSHSVCTHARTHARTHMHART
jgi:hypothetical protein